MYLKMITLSREQEVDIATFLQYYCVSGLLDKLSDRSPQRGLFF